MLINKLHENIKRQLFSRNVLTVLISCVLLLICGLLSGASVGMAAQQNSVLSVPYKPNNKVPRLAPFKQDPTRPPSIIVQQLSPELAAQPEYQLTAIFMRDNRKYAVLNGKVLKTGDSVADMFITQISTSNLTMEHASSTKSPIVLELNGAVNIKTQVTK